jgi:hypothetical protein
MKCIYKLVHQFDKLYKLEDLLICRRILHIKVDIKKRMIPVIVAYLRPRFTNKFTRRPANTTPQKFADTADQKGISRIEAMMAPVHAPVPGKGTATKSIRPSH